MFSTALAAASAAIAVRVRAIWTASSVVALNEVCCSLLARFYFCRILEQRFPANVSEIIFRNALQIIIIAKRRR